MLDQIVALGLLVPCVWISVVDLRTHLIPDGASGLVAALGLGHILLGPTPTDVSIEVTSAVLILLLFWALGEVYWRRKQIDGLGFGDAKLMAAGVLCIGIAQFWMMLFVAAVGGIVVALLAAKRKEAEPVGVPFGPFLSFSIFLVFLLGAAG